HERVQLGQRHAREGTPHREPLPFVPVRGGDQAVDRPVRGGGRVELGQTGQDEYVVHGYGGHGTLLTRYRARARSLSRSRCPSRVKTRSTYATSASSRSSRKCRRTDSRWCGTAERSTASPCPVSTA